MCRVLRPGGVLLLSTWCQAEGLERRELSARQRRRLRLLFDRWAVPCTASIMDYLRLVEVSWCMRYGAAACG